MKGQKSWYAVQTKPRQEEKVLFFLKQKGFNTYFPKIQTYIYKGLKKYKKIKPLFPNYLFVKCERKKINQVCWTYGVKKVLWKNTQPQPIAAELISSIRSLAGKDGLIRKRNYKKNDLLRIKTGPFKGVEALFDHWESDGERVCLLLNLINAQIKVAVPASVVEVA